MQAILQLIARLRANKHTSGAGAAVVVAYLGYSAVKSFAPEWFSGHKDAIREFLNAAYMACSAYGLFAAGDSGQTTVQWVTHPSVSTGNGPGFTFTQTSDGVCLNPQPPTQG